MAIPETFLSVNTIGGRRLWRCIHQALPLCKDSDIADSSLAQYRHVMGWPVGVDLGIIPVYDGDTGEFTVWPDEQNDSEILKNQDGCPITYAAIRKAMDGENYKMSLVGEDSRVVIEAVNIGIDYRLQVCNGENDDYGDGKRTITADWDCDYWKAGDKLGLAHTLECSVSPKSLPVLLRRLFDDLKEEGAQDTGMSLASCILEGLGFDDSGVHVGRVALGLE